jgi:hypothetical protein
MDRTALVSRLRREMTLDELATPSDGIACLVRLIRATA